MSTAGLVSLIIGIIIGYLGQRSRFCIISGIRDFYLMRDTYRLKGLLGVLIGALLGFVVVSFLGGRLEHFPLIYMGLDIKPRVLILISIIGGFGMGFFSVLAEGCPFRQHVMAGEGRISGVLYLVGFAAGVIFFSAVIVKYLELIMLLG